MKSSSLWRKVMAISLYSTQLAPLVGPFFFSIGSTAFASAETSSQRLLDYDLLSHSLRLEYLRAGNHDPKGKNSYYFKTSLVGLVDDEAEHILPVDKKKRIEEVYETFGSIELAAFKSFSQKENDKSVYVLEVDGDALRELVRRVMNELRPKKEEHLPESKVGVKVKLELYEREKKFFVIDEDQLIGSTEYFAIPFSSSDKKIRQNQMLEFGDKKGLKVKVKLSYKELLPTPT